MKSSTQVKKSVLRDVRKQLLDNFPALEPDIDVILPKKQPVWLTKWFALRVRRALLSSRAGHTARITSC